MAFVNIVVFLENTVFTSYFADTNVIPLMWENTNIKIYDSRNQVDTKGENKLGLWMVKYGLKKKRETIECGISQILWLN